MDIQLPQILFQLVNFSIVAGALTYLLYKPIQKIFEERAKRIEDGQKAAEASLAEKNKLDDYKQRVKQETDKKAAQLIEDTRKQTEQRRKELLAEAKQTAQAEKKKLLAEWEVEKQQLVTSLKADLVKASLLASQKLITTKLDKKAHQRLVDQEIKNLLTNL